MNSLRSILKQHARIAKAVPGGADDFREAPAALPPPLNRDALWKELDALRRTNTWSMVAIVVIIIALAVATGLLIHRYIDNAPVVTSLFVGFGTLAAALTAVTASLLKIKGQSDFLSILANHLDGQTVQTIVDVLAKRL